MITAISYDPANRPVDIIEGAQTTQADPRINDGEFAVPDPSGLANTRTRTIYNADGQAVATLPPQAFSNTASLTAPATDTARRVDYDLDGLPTTSYSPRYDNATSTQPGGGMNPPGESGDFGAPRVPRSRDSLDSHATVTMRLRSNSIGESHPS